jgi:RND family efflux transporter MFP subunit
VARDAACGGPNKVACDQAQAAVGNGDVAVRRAQEELDRALAGPAADEIQVAQLNVEKAQARLAQLTAPPDEATLKAAQLQQEQAQARLAELTAGPSQVDLKQAEAAVRSTQLALEQAQAALQATTLAAPFNGIVLEVRASPGETVAAGAGLIRLADTSAVEVEATVVEEDFPLVQAGQPVELFFDARPEVTVKGRVARIVPQRGAGDSPVYPIYIALDEAPTGLVPGMTVDASVFIAQRTDVLRLPRSLARARSDGAALVKVWNGLTTEERTVKVGLRGNQYVEILEGLREGEQVVSR